MGGIMGKKCLASVCRLLEKAGYENPSTKRKLDFSRKRKMPFKKLIRFMFSMIKESSQNALEGFFPKI
jgi:hypothetical protein